MFQEFQLRTSFFVFLGKVIDFGQNMMTTLLFFPQWSIYNYISYTMTKKSIIPKGACITKYFHRIVFNKSASHCHPSLT
jgi:hypothetical protein